MKIGLDVLVNIYNENCYRCTKANKMLLILINLCLFKNVATDIQVYMPLMFSDRAPYITYDTLFRCSFLFRTLIISSSI